MTSKNLRVSAELRALYSDWCLPRRGNANPEIMTNDIWVWMIETGLRPSKAHEAIGIGESKSPGWTFSRIGSTETTLADGSVVYVGGEHSDWEDNASYTYNDVIVKSPHGSISIYGYPEEIFPPSYDHTATLVGDQIFIIGRIGYLEQLEKEATSVLVLDTKSYCIRSLKTSGTQPGWLFKHTAKLSSSGDAIICDEGRVRRLPTGKVIENIATWRVSLQTGQWDLLSKKPWTLWIMLRQDGSLNQISQIAELEKCNRTGRRSENAEDCNEMFEKRGHSPDLELYRNRYVFPVKHEQLPGEAGDILTWRFRINGVVVRYKQISVGIHVTVEGTLPASTIFALKSHGLETFSKLDGVPYKILNF